ncbi:MAG: phage late control D family protein [Propionivibrio sp.]|uniref:phage late control D family protein n=1 Tax=Propionivibrio sp. TaxID=2212460 RepID=UPI001A39AC13|nr:contractile injection system protein, VgrG/Pvc8 family [Propionivibrio sp.]MBL8414995.1 phage late control D family protein [Propionivibrio sp.]
MARLASSTTTGTFRAKPDAVMASGGVALAGQLKVKVDGLEVPDLLAGMIDCVIEHRRTTPSSCTATFSNWGPTPTGVGYLHFGRVTLDFGKGFTVAFGEADLFHGRIATLEGGFPEGSPPVIRIVAGDALADLAEHNGFRTFSDMSDADVVRRVASEYGLSTQLRLTGPSRRVIAQAGESDLEFIRARLAAIGAYCWIDTRGRLCAVHEPGGREAAILLNYGGNLTEFCVRADVRRQSTAARARGWDIAAKESLSSSADQTVLTSEIPATGCAGAWIRESIFGSAERRLAEPALGSATEVESVARAAFADRAREFLTGIAHLADARQVLPGRRVDIRGVGPLFSGLYRIETVTHRFDLTRGCRTEFTVERPWLGAP